MSTWELKCKMHLYNVWLWLLGKCYVECWQFSNISTDIAVTVFRVSGLEGGQLLYRSCIRQYIRGEAVTE